MPPPDGHGYGIGPQATFYQTITAAVADLAEHGYDSAERLAFWMHTIREAAMRSMTPPHVLEKALRDALRSVYTKQVERGAILKLHPEVARFTLAQVAPKLRGELDRRILASADLIKLNREKAIQETLSRLSGWATSIPAGGSEVVRRAEEKLKIRKPLASLPFAERRVIIDQAHKLTSALSEIVATDNQALAGHWRSHYAERNYNYRPEHKHFDVVDQFFVVRDNWALRAGLIKVDGYRYTDQIERPGELVFCLPGDTRIPFADGVEIAYRRWYSGDLAEVVTSSGKTLRATPNHPVMTPHGWIAIGALNEGDYVIEVGDYGVDSVVAKSNGDHAIPSIQEIFGSFYEAGVLGGIAGSREQFHGDGSAGNVDIVYAARPLRLGNVSARPQGVHNIGLSHSTHGSPCGGSFQFFINCWNRVAPCIVRGLNKALATFLAFTDHPKYVCFGTIPGGYSSLGQSFDDSASLDAKSIGDRKNAFTSQMRGAYTCIIKRYSIGNADEALSNIDFMSPDPTPQAIGSEPQNWRDLRNSLPFETKLMKVVNIKRSAFAGHVYNLQTVGGWYIAEGIVTHNCRCYYEWKYSLRSLPTAMLTEKGRAELARVRIVA